jgi:hypothetical protein
MNIIMWVTSFVIAKAYPKIESEWQVFEDAYKSPLSIIILDDIERCVDLGVLKITCMVLGNVGFSAQRDEQ